MRHNQPDIVVFILRNEEWAWFAANAVMPVVPADVPANTLSDTGGLLAGVSELRRRWLGTREMRHERVLGGLNSEANLHGGTQMAAGLLFVIGIAGLLFIGALIALVVWLARRTQPSNAADSNERPAPPQ